MKGKDVLSTAITGTTFMTLYSIVVSEVKNKNFKEPEILSQLLHRLLPALKKRNARIAGWIAHYTVGVLFAAVYIYLWEKKNIKPTIWNGVIMGGVTGFPAVLIWKATLKLHAFPPKLHVNRYYLQLIMAHMIFGSFCVIGHKLYQK